MTRPTDGNQHTAAIDDPLSGGPADVPISNAAAAESSRVRRTISPAQLRQTFENDVMRAGRGVRRALATAVREAVRAGRLALIRAGVSHGLRILSRVLAGRGARNVAVESYGLHTYSGLLAAAGLKTLLPPLDTHGTDPVPPDGTDAVLLTPAHQFPVGTALRRDRRMAVVDWAGRTGGLVLEDDYDGEFRFDRQRVGALQGLAPDCVAYLGTASNTLAPGLRLAWMALPPTLAAETVAAKEPIDSCEVVSQLTMAEFITSGAYSRHLRAARRRYRDRRDSLVTALAQHAPEVRVIGTAAGLHTVLGLPPGKEQQVLQSATRQGLKVAGLSLYRNEPSLNVMADALVVGYGVPSDDAWPQALSALVRALS
ncbi:aminotransferase class I/II-fold pyridoxal phosphate-dependent enzyme [Streptomyces fagopyri]|uniref:aminotransferase class I/II-fold pyridoxal phosphate-dependent enzyme n=1 Tax=Streptomyces fagopyri TaxID=2662397 RepID=UPI0038236A9A